MQKTIALTAAAGLLVLGGASAAQAQLTAAQDGPIVYGHHHLAVTSIDEHKRFWVDTLGGELVTFGTSEIVKFPNVLVFMREGEPTAPLLAPAVRQRIADRGLYGA